MRIIPAPGVIDRRVPVNAGRVHVRLSNGENAYMPCALLTGLVEEETANLAALLECGWSSRAALEETISSADLRGTLYAIMRETFVKVAGDVPFDL